MVDSATQSGLDGLGQELLMIWMVLEQNVVEEGLVRRVGTLAGDVQLLIDSLSGLAHSGHFLVGLLDSGQ